MASNPVPLVGRYGWALWLTVLLTAANVWYWHRYGYGWYECITHENGFLAWLAYYIILSIACRYIRRKIVFQVRGLLLSLLLICFPIVSYIGINRHMKTSLAFDTEGLFPVWKSGQKIMHYAKFHGRFPGKESWTEECSVGSGEIYGPKFSDSDDDAYRVVFNSHLSKKRIHDISRNVILVFDSDGEKNLFGDKERFFRKRSKDHYYLEKHRYVYAMLTDGTIIKYRLVDGAVSRFMLSVSDLQKLAPSELKKGFSEYCTDDMVLFE